MVQPRLVLSTGWLRESYGHDPPGDLRQPSLEVSTIIEEWRNDTAAQDYQFAEFFKGAYPANTLVEIGALAEPGLDVEIEAIAELG